MFRSIIVATALLFTAVQAQAAPITYDFEGEATTAGGALTVLVLTEDGLTMTLEREASYSLRYLRPQPLWSSGELG